MLPFTTQDAVTALKKAGNLNAALKNFLKKELQNGDPASRFVKDLRELINTPNVKRFENYIENSRDKFETHIVAIGGYAHSAMVSGIVGKVADKYADEFNTTYSTTDGKIQISNQKRFDQIVKEALVLIDAELKSAGFPESTYMKNVVMISIFDRPVLEHIIANAR